MSKPHIAVIGGGITGLSAAYTLLQAQQAGADVNITLIEKSDCLGGKIGTVRADGNVIESGPDSFLARKPAALELCAELGLTDQLVETSPLAAKTFLVHDLQLHPFPSGTYMGIPMYEEVIRDTDLLTQEGKNRALEDFAMSNQSPLEDESLGRFLTRRLGREMVERIAEAVVSGIYGGHADQLGLLATFPEFRNLEQEYGSLLLGLQEYTKKARERIRGPQQSAFRSLKNGLQTIIDQLEKELKAIHMLRGVAVSHIEEDITHGYQLSLSTGDSMHVDAIIVTTPAFVTAKMFKHKPLTALLDQIPYGSVAIVTLLFDAQHFQVTLEGSGFVVPRIEQTTITACTWLSSKWPHSTGGQDVALRCFVGRSDDASILLETDEMIVERVLDDLHKIMGSTAVPKRTWVNRWESSMPQYTVGHLERLHMIEDIIASDYPGVMITGAAFRGVGIPDCIAQGKKAALQSLVFVKIKL